MPLFVLALLQAAAVPTVVDPLLPAWAGQVQCYAPDPVRRECSSIGVYRKGPAGAVLNEAAVLISESPPVVMTTVAPVQIRGGAICGIMKPGDVAASTFRVAGAAATPEQTARLRKQMASAMTSLFGKEICTSMSTKGGRSIGEARVDGVLVPEMEQPVVWVPVTDGYKIRSK